MSFLCSKPVFREASGFSVAYMVLCYMHHHSSHPRRTHLCAYLLSALHNLCSWFLSQHHSRLLGQGEVAGSHGLLQLPSTIHSKKAIGISMAPITLLAPAHSSPGLVSAQLRQYV